MKIEKEIIFAAKIAKVRDLLDKSGIKNKGSFLEIDALSKNSGHSQGSKTGATSSGKERGSEALSTHITAEFDLAEFGPRTLLKITVHGWDKLNPEKAKLEMPRVALLLEQKLSQMKKTLEKHSRA